MFHWSQYYYGSAPIYYRGLLAADELNPQPLPPGPPDPERLVIRGFVSR
jgi:hypothetical protein